MMPDSIGDDPAFGDGETLAGVLASVEAVARYARSHDLDGLDEILTYIVAHLVATRHKGASASDMGIRMHGHYDA